MEWPPQSPDLNIIEAVWDYLERKKLEKQPTTEEVLWHVLSDAWNNKTVFFIELMLFWMKKGGIQNIECSTLFCAFYVHFCKPAVLKFMITMCFFNPYIH